MFSTSCCIVGNVGEHEVKCMKQQERLHCLCINVSRLHYVHTSVELGEDTDVGCSFGSGSGFCGVSVSDISILGELISLCLLSSNSNSRRSSWETEYTKINKQPSKYVIFTVTQMNAAESIYSRSSDLMTPYIWSIQMLKLSESLSHMAAHSSGLTLCQRCKHALQKSTHLLVVFLDHHVQAWVGVRVQTAMSNAVCRWWLEVSANVSHDRWLTRSLSRRSLSALASFSFFSISTRSKRHGLYEDEEI